MKKFVVLISALLFLTSTVYAKDYAKMQIKEMKHAQKYNTTQKVLQNKTSQSPKTTTVSGIKDPKIMRFGNYKEVSKAQYEEKLKKDNALYSEYEKVLGKKHSKYYTTQADAEDFYKIYRVTERLIRANKLDYINWRISIYKDTENPNAYTSSVNHIAISTSLLDTFTNNDDALALIIGHEMGHALLGHQKRSNQLLVKMERERKLAALGNSIAAAAYIGMKKKYLIDSKNMEYAADVEGAKLALRAGYNLNKASDVLTFLSTFDIDKDFRSDHPDSTKRIENLNENAKYFPEGWKAMGEYNIYNSSVLPVQLSSDRKSIVISVSDEKLNPNQYYSPETMEEVYARFGYMYYINGQFEKSLNNFKDLFKIDETNASAYLYASYASEYLYKNTKNSKYLNTAKEYAKKALELEPDNKYIKEQVEAL